jgi:hypothetical protein
LLCNFFSNSGTHLSEIFINPQVFIFWQLEFQM